MSKKREEVARALEILRRYGYVIEVKPPPEWQRWMEEFLPAYRKHRQVTLSSEVAGVSLPTVYKYYKLCKRFRDKVDEIRPLKVKTD